MKKYLLKYVVAVALFLCMGLAILFGTGPVFRADSGRRNTLINRFVQEVEGSSEDINDAIASARAANEDSWEKEYGSENVPSDITFIAVDADLSGKVTDDSESRVIWAVNRDGRTVGFAVFTFDDTRETKAIIIGESVVIVSFLMIILFFIYIDRKVLMPFNTLSAYPEKLANNETGEHIPESKEKYFGKYIWGMNMLNDRLRGDRKKLRTLEKEKQTMISTIAHGIKTPVSNIRLYSEAIRSGLYKKDGIPDPEDAAVADKIEKNAQDIESLVKELVNSASQGVIEFEPHAEGFYLSEIEEWITDEYSNRLNVLKIPFEVECRSRVMINTDKSGVIRILKQFMENAIKYGDGKRIGAVIEKNDEGYIFTVSNTGSRVPENEERYVFNSFWRGSNAESVEGNGLGLYEASYIARKLGGAVATRFNEDTKETEFSVFLPL